MNSTRSGTRSRSRSSLPALRRLVAIKMKGDGMGGSFPLSLDANRLNTLPTLTGIVAVNVGRVAGDNAAARNGTGDQAGSGPPPRSGNRDRGDGDRPERVVQRR